jgi:hypothetical protein
VGRPRFIGILLGAVVAACFLAPATALAGTYTWALASDFTGANPDHDQYGGAPWSYSETSGSSIARNGSGKIEMRPAQGGSVAVKWSSPFNAPMSVSVAWSATLPGGLGCLPIVTGASSQVLDQGGAPIGNGGSATIPAGGSLSLIVKDTSVSYVPACDTATVSFTIQAQAAVPSVSLTSPSPGSLIAGIPTFAGTATDQFGDSGQVIVKVYGGSSVTGTPVQTLTANRSRSSYSVPASAQLPDGQYTAQASQTDVSAPPLTGFSAPVTFVIHNAPPTVTLNALDSKPLHTATPTLTGVAGTTAGDSSTVYAVIYPGKDTTTTPIRSIAGHVGAGGHFSITVTPALDDGIYTAIVAQQAAGGVGLSAPRTFRVKVHGPALTLAVPAAGGSVAQADVVFTGQAGIVPGDFPRISVWLYRGARARGKPLGIVHALANGASWLVRWPHKLKLGLYSAKAVQGDDAGHTTTTRSHTFLIVPGPSVIGPAVALDRSGDTSVSVTCLAPAGQVCSGTVLALTVSKLQPSRGAPPGKLRVVFAYVTINGGSTVIVRDTVPPAAARALRRVRPRVAITAQMSIAGGPASTFSAERPLRVQ